MKILIDESLPRALKKQLSKHTVATVQQPGWSSIKNGELLRRTNKAYQILPTADQNMPYQQNLKDMLLAIVIFPTNRMEIVMQLVSRLEHVLQIVGPGQVVEL